MPKIENKSQYLMSPLGWNKFVILLFQYEVFLIDWINSVFLWSTYSKNISLHYKIFHLPWHIEWWISHSPLFQLPKHQNWHYEQRQFCPLDIGCSPPKTWSYLDKECWTFSFQTCDWSKIFLSFFVVGEYGHCVATSCLRR